MTVHKLGKVRISGLLYPIKDGIASATAYSPLFGLRDNCKFIIDDPNISKESVLKDRFYNVLKESIK